MRRVIERKREGGDIQADRWHDIIAGFMDGTIDEAQMAALCMACVLRGMSFDEAYALTQAMVASGEVLRFSPSAGMIVDKHSSGGVSDIVSLVAVPLAAACGAKVAKLSGRALGHTGGTIDKLETIPGFHVAPAMEDFVAQVETVGCGIASQSEALVPADKRIYHLRDRTATVPSMGLIASSIVSKKIAGGAEAFVFDVKAGAASFMQNPDDARELAGWLVEIASRFGRRARAFVTDMNQPLARSIGTGIEIIEAREMLRGSGDERARELAVAVAGALIAYAGAGDAQARARRALADGSAYEKFAEMIVAQGGNVEAFERMQTDDGVAIPAPSSGYVGSIDVVELGHVGRRLSHRDPMGGLRVAVRIGDYVEPGTPLAFAHGRDRNLASHVAHAFKLSQTPVEAPPLILSS